MTYTNKTIMIRMDDALKPISRASAPYILMSIFLLHPAYNSGLPGHLSVATLDILPLSAIPHLIPLTLCLTFTTLSCDSAQTNMKCVFIPCCPWMSRTCCQGKQILITCPTLLGSLG